MAMQQIVDDTDLSQTDPLWLKSYPQGIDWREPLETYSLVELLERAVAKWGDRPAIDFMDRQFTYREIGALTNKVAKGLQAQGLKKGDRIGLFLPNCPYFMIFYFGILKAGGTVVNINPLYADREVAHLLNDSGAEMVVTLDLTDLYGKLAPMFGHTPLRKIIVCPMGDILPMAKRVLFTLAKRKEIVNPPRDAKHIWYGDLIDNDGRHAPLVVNPQTDIAVLQYTGGTTGTPKGAMLTHANLTANAEQCKLWFKGAREGQEKMLAVLPLFHVFAMTGAMNLGIRIGAEIVMLPRFALDDVLNAIHLKKCTIFPAVPTIFSAINNYKKREKYNLSSIRYCISGGAPLPVEVKLTFERVTGCVLVEGYGLSETAPVACVNPIIGENRTGSIGLPVPGTMVEIISIEDRNTPVALGERGEICISGPQVMAGYWKKPEDTAESIRNGRFHTGDIATMDKDGYIYIVDRLKDMIIAGGYNIYPRNVEEAVIQNASVEEVVCAGVPDTYRGETVKVWIKLKEGCTLTVPQLKEFLEDKLSPIEMPKLVEFRDQPLPKTLIGKLSKKALLEEEMAKRAASGAEEAPAEE